jgi:CubicO group peptidase (beta-lactamase class C family)
MKLYSAVLISSFFAILLGGCTLTTQNPSLSLLDPYHPDFDLDSFIQDEIEKERIPGLAAAVIVGDELVWAKGYGFRNIETQAPVTTTTPFRLASVSKLFTGTGMMMAWESGAFEWEADINDYLPFEVENPLKYPEPITPLNLATHTSGIVENGAIVQCGTYYYDENGAPASLTNWVKEKDVCQNLTPLELGTYLKEYLTPTGDIYDENLNFTTPNKFSYTNAGTALAGYLVESITDIPFDTYLENNIFQPLAMENTRIGFEDFDPAEIAYPHIPDGDQIIPMPPYTYAAWPAGGIWSNVEDLAKFLIVIMNKGQYDGGQILSAESVKIMLTPVYDDNQAIFWYQGLQRWGQGTHVLIGHIGQNYGVATMMFFEPETDTGVIVLANLQERSRKAGAFKIMRILFEHSEILANK